MNLQLNEQQQLLRETAVKLFRSESTAERVRAAEATGFDTALWAQFVDMGLHLTRVPESTDGAGLGLFEAVLIAEEAGRYLASIPLAESVVANRLLAMLDGSEAAAALNAARSGTLFSFMPQPLRADEAHIVPGAAVAAGVIAFDGDRILLIKGLEGPRESNLGASALRRLTLKGKGAVGQAQLLASGVDARAAFLAAIEEWKLLTAAMLVGLSRQALDMAALYSRDRQQFGRAIGSFQGIAHPAADALTDVEGAQLLLWRAVWAIASGRKDAAANVSMAFWWISQAATRTTTRALRTFGGYGVSVEYDIQLYYRRAKAWALVTGDPQQELYRVADRLWGADAQIPLPDAGSMQLEFGCGARAETFAEQARAFFRENLTTELKAHAHHSVAGFHADFNRQLAKAGLLFPHWPRKYGGLERDAFDNAALAEVFEEFNWQRITAPITNQVAQIVMQFGSEQVKQEALQRFASGEALACLGFSEPSCGSDVFAAKTRAERVGDDWLINGQKIFTTAANLAHYVFLLTRTAPELPKHAGLTLFLVPMDLPGVDVQAVHTLQDERTNITYFTDVRVPDRYRIGEVNGGIAVMAATLELEHGGDHYRISYSKMFAHALHWAQTTLRDGRRVLDDPDARLRLARVAVHTTIAKSLCYRAIWAITNKVPGRASFGPMSKLFSTEMYLRDAADLMDLGAPDSLVPGDAGLGEVEIGYRQAIGMTIYGGTSEVHRSLIAEQGLGMPRSRT
jgi:3-oxochol-4-en-24-oyl-CoA dehydrogenase